MAGASFRIVKLGGASHQVIQFTRYEKLLVVDEQTKLK